MARLAERPHVVCVESPVPVVAYADYVIHFRGWRDNALCLAVDTQRRLTQHPLTKATPRGSVIELVLLRAPLVVLALPALGCALAVSWGSSWGHRLGFAAAVRYAPIAITGSIGDNPHDRAPVFTLERVSLRLVLFRQVLHE